MNCPNGDKLLQYVDEWIDEKERKAIEKHLQSCTYCTDKVKEWAKEKALLIETLKSPVLPEDFAETIVAQIKPYKPKRRQFWKWGLGTAASALLAGGILFTVNPGFADFINGIFSSDFVDKGLQQAINTDIATPIDIAVTDAGITLQFEHLIADTSRIAVSYKIVDSNGKKLNPYMKDTDQKVIQLLDENKEEVILSSWGWQNADDYGIIEFSLVDIEHFTKGTIRIGASELAGRKGNWQVDIPVDLTKAYDKLQIVEIGETFENEDIEVTLHKVNYATSTTDITYSTEYSETWKQRLKEELAKKEKQFNQEIVHTFFPYQPRIGYRIENGNGDVLGYYNIYGREDRGHPVDSNMIGGLGKWDGEGKELGRVTWTDSFVPEKEEKDLYFVLDTIYKTKTSDFAITFHPNELPFTFEYKGYELTIDSVERKTDYSITKEWFPIQRKVFLELQLSGYADQKAPELALWTIEDGAGKSYFTFNSSSILDETDDKGRFKREIQLVTYELEKVPEEMTLHLIAEIEAIKLENEWRVPLFDK